MKKLKFPVVSIIMFVLAGLFLVFTVWSAVNSFQYISEMIAQGQLTMEGNFFNVVSFHMTNFSPYLVYTALLFGLGWIIKLVTPDIVIDLDTDELVEETLEELLDDDDEED